MMHPTVLRVAIGCLVALALLDAAAARPHSTADPASDRHTNGVNHHHRHHTTEPTHHRTFLCGAQLKSAVRTLCASKGFMAANISASGAALDCCTRGCTQQELEQQCETRCRPLGKGILTSANNRKSMVILCGRNLSDELHAVCAPRGFMSAQSPNNARGSRRGLGGGVATDCCRLGCTRQYIESYCQPCEGVDEGSDSESNETEPQSNHIRAEVERPAATEPPPPQSPVAPGGSPAGSIKPMRFPRNDTGANMIGIGVLKLPGSPVIPERHRSSTTHYSTSTGTGRSH